MLIETTPMISTVDSQRYKTYDITDKYKLPADKAIDEESSSDMGKESLNPS